MIDSVSLLFLARTFLFSGVFWLGKNLGRHHEREASRFFHVLLYQEIHRESNECSKQNNHELKLKL